MIIKSTQKEGILYSLFLELPDYMQYFKHSGNDIRIFHRKNKAGVSKPFPIHINNHSHEMKRLEQEFSLAWRGNPVFEGPVECLMVFGKRTTGGRWDSTNQLKAACDFLERVGIVKNDYLVECTARRRQSYPETFKSPYGSFIYLERLTEHPMQGYLKGLNWYDRTTLGTKD